MRYSPFHLHLRDRRTPIMKKLSIGGAVLLLAAAACFGACGDDSSPGDDRGFDAGGDGSDHDSHDSGLADSGNNNNNGDSGFDAGPSVQYQGTLNDSGQVTFGPSGACTYKVAMKFIMVTLWVGETGQIKAAEVRNTWEQANLGTCPEASPPSKSHEYSLKTNESPSAATQKLTFTGKAENSPKTALTADVTKNGDRYDAALTWVRDDGATGDLVWTVKAKVTVAR
jgi:hypothetical protein